MEALKCLYLIIIIFVKFSVCLKRRDNLSSGNNKCYEHLLWNVFVVRVGLSVLLEYNKSVISGRILRQVHSVLGLDHYSSIATTGS